MRVEVYYNLHKNVFSIRHKGRVIKHSDKVVIENAEYVVRKSGRERVLKEGKKNVHAFVRGNWIDGHDGLIQHEIVGGSMSSITYNPYKYDSFVYKDNEEPIHKSDWAVLRKTIDMPPKIMAWNGKTTSKSICKWIT